MPRGNDESAARDLAASVGEGVGNAEDLIERTYADRSPEFEAAQMKALDEEATAELDITKLSGPNGEEVVSAAVRGGVTIVVYLDERGGYSKALASEDKKASKKPSTKE